MEDAEGREVSGDGEAEKLHFDGGKLNQLCNGGPRADRQIETVMSAPGDYCQHVLVYLDGYLCEDQFMFCSFLTSKGRLRVNTG